MMSGFFIILYLIVPLLIVIGIVLKNNGRSSYKRETTGERVELYDGFHTDVVIIGAGIAGIGSAVGMNKQCPNKDFVLLEARSDVGGTWDLFRYPGLRSDNPKFQFGFSFKHWKEPNILADGDEMKNYLSECCEEFGIEERICYQKKLISASFSSITSRWELEIQETDTKETILISCDFLNLSNGYYDYDRPHLPTYPGEENYRGEIVHPQFWGETDCTDKTVVIIGSGATAISIIPPISKVSKHTVMLQRTPGYITFSQTPSFFAYIYKLWPSMFSTLARYYYIIVDIHGFYYSTKNPEQSKGRMLDNMRNFVNVEKRDCIKDPPYMPGEQRVCRAPNGDVLETVNKGKTSIVTDSIRCFDENGIKLKSGEYLPCDIIVSATGLTIQLNGIKIIIDGEEKRFHGGVDMVKGHLIGGFPNFCKMMGYTNTSWGLKTELSGNMFATLISHMNKKGYTKFTPRNCDDDSQRTNYADYYKANYYQREKTTYPSFREKSPYTHPTYLEDFKEYYLTPRSYYNTLDFS